VRGRAVEVRFASNDTYSTLQQAEYSLDAGDWKMIFPESGTTDARQHSYRFRLDNIDAGEHTVVVRVYDRFDNPVLDKATFTIEAGEHTVVVRVYDRFDNPVLDKATFTIE
jgi:hypothetical protein